MSETAQTVADEREAPKELPELKNLKSEFDRKLANLEKSNQALLSHFQNLAKPRVEEEPKQVGSVKDVWYDDPDKAATEVTNRAVNAALSKIKQEQVEQNKRGTVIQQLYREYPELQDFDHPLTTRAVEIFNNISDEDKTHPMAYRLAVKEAAEELEIKSKSRRKESDEGFSLGSNSGKAPRAPKAKKEALDQRTIDFARLAGLNVDDEKTLESLKNRAQRSNWNRWE